MVSIYYYFLYPFDTLVDATSDPLDGAEKTKKEKKKHSSDGEKKERKRDREKKERRHKDRSKKEKKDEPELKPSEEYLADKYKVDNCNSVYTPVP